MWRELEASDDVKLKKILVEREATCVTLISKILSPLKDRRQRSSIKRIYVHDRAGVINGVVVYTSSKMAYITLPHGQTGDVGLLRSFNFFNFKTVIGSKGDVDRFNNRLKLEPAVSVEYRLMELEAGRWANCMGQEPRNFFNVEIRPVGLTDIKQVFPLQAEYEREEVLTSIHEFNQEHCLRVLRKSLQQEVMLGAFLEGKCIAKISINATSFNYEQIGGVFVHKDYRRRGLARLMLYHVVNNILAREKKAILFVKNHNIAAYRLYQDCGFKEIGDYCAVYFL